MLPNPPPFLSFVRRPYLMDGRKGETFNNPGPFEPAEAWVEMPPAFAYPFSPLTREMSRSSAAWNMYIPLGEELDMR